VARTTLSVEAETLADLDSIIAILQALRANHKPMRILLGAPLVLKNGKLTVANIELPNDEVLIIPILTDNDVGMPVPPPPGDVFSVSTSSPSLSAAIDITTLTPPGTPGVKINANVQVSPGLSFTISDSAGLPVFVQGVDIMNDTTPKAITLDIPHAVVQSQPVPAAPGP
jgi:hypothetical protein